MKHLRLGVDNYYDDRLFEDITEFKELVYLELYGIKIKVPMCEVLDKYNHLEIVLIGAKKLDLDNKYPQKLFSTIKPTIKCLYLENIPMNNSCLNLFSLM